MAVIKENKGFTYLELLIAMAILVVFLGIFIQLDKFNIVVRGRTDEVNRITMLAQGVMDAYRGDPSKFAPIDPVLKEAAIPPALITELGTSYSWYSDNDSVKLTVDDVAVPPNSVPAQTIETSKLKKITVTVTPKTSGLDKIRLISYQPN